MNCVLTDTELIILGGKGKKSEPVHAITLENGKKTHQSKSCYGSHGNRGGVNGRQFAFRPSVHSGQSWTFVPHWTKSEKDDRKWRLYFSQSPVTGSGCSGTF